MRTQQLQERVGKTTLQIQADCMVEAAARPRGLVVLLHTHRPVPPGLQHLPPAGPSPTRPAAVGTPGSWHLFFEKVFIFPLPESKSHKRTGRTSGAQTFHRDTCHLHTAAWPAGNHQECLPEEPKSLVRPQVPEGGALCAKARCGPAQDPPGFLAQARDFRLGTISILVKHTIQWH